MIKASELRIGNLLFADWKAGCIVKVKEIRETKVIVNDDDWSGLKHDEVSPIPLTLEILEKCGLNLFWGVHCWCFKDIEIREEHPDYWLITDEEGGGDDNIRKIGKPFQFVHQLQNLIFDLLGEELNVQL